MMAEILLTPTCSNLYQITSTMKASSEAVRLKKKTHISNHPIKRICLGIILSRRQLLLC